MQSVVRALAAAVGVVLLVLGGIPVALSAVAEAPGESAPVYVYAGDHHTGAPTSVAVERGPPSVSYVDTAHFADSPGPRGASARPDIVTGSDYTTYAGPTRSAQVTVVRTTTTTAAVPVVGTSALFETTGVAANAARSFGQFGVADIRAAAGAADRGGLTRVGRALQKHSDRSGSVFGGLSSGNPIARNEQGMRVLDEILEDPGSTTQVLDNVTNIWDSTGRGIRINNDGTFMGFLEPLP